MPEKTSVKIDNCTLCGRCVSRCPKRALSIRPTAGGCYAEVRSDLCLGPSCRICEKHCRDGLLHLDRLL